MSYDLTGKRFGALTVVKLNHKDKRAYLFWDCICDCGKTVIVRGIDLKHGAVTSCGCGAKTDEEDIPVGIKVGQKVRFDPFAEITGFSSELNRGKFVTGTVAMINHKHKWFSVIYGNPEKRTSFDFSQIGKEIKLSK